MNDKKHIDRLFQEGLKDFEATPKDAVWDNIEAKLKQKKKKRRVIPIWWRYAGLAALLLLLLTIGGIYFNSASNDFQTTEQIVDTKNNTSEKTDTKNQKSSEAIENAANNKPVITDNNDKNINSKENKNNSTQNKTNLEVPSNKLTPSYNASVAKTSSETASSKNKNESKVLKSLRKILNTKNKLGNPSKNNAVANITEEKKATKVAISEENNNITKKENPIIDKEKAKNLINNVSKNNTAIAEVKKEDTEKVNDNTENNLLTIEEALAKNKDIIEEEEETQNRWSIAPNAAPVYFNSLNGGSSIDPQFNNNSKTGELNMSYGLSASYAINKKLTIRSGVNKVNLGYNTNDVVVFQSAGVSSSRSSVLQNVSATSSNTNSNSIQADDVVSRASFESINTSNVPESLQTSNASINQALGFIEVPLEIQYTLSDKKFGVNIIGGFSSLFLNNNEIFSEAENGTRTFLGEANNINKVSYSANLGLGLNYKMSKKIDLNLEPIFKYQINTFKNTSGSFTPFFIGVYTGFAIKF